MMQIMDRLRRLGGSQPQNLAILYVAFITFAPYDSAQQSEVRRERDASRIINGTDALPHEFPSMARLTDSSLGHFCGASIIDRNFVVTAAHCVLDRSGNPQDPGYFRVVVGDHMQSTKESSEQILEVVRVIPHEKFTDDNGSFRNGFDIAILQIHPAIHFNAKVQPTNLPECNSYSPGEAWIVGWGLTEAEKPAPPGMYPPPPRPANTLQKRKITMLPDGECINNSTMKPLPTRIICFRDYDGGACYGDSGGPMYIRTHDNTTWTQVGITSGGPRGCNGGDNLYTKVSYFNGWIHRRVSGCGNFPYRE